MNEVVKVACVQAEPVPFDRAETIEKLDRLVGEVAAAGARAGVEQTRVMHAMCSRALHSNR